MVGQIIALAVIAGIVYLAGKYGVLGRWWRMLKGLWSTITGNS